MIWWNGYSAFYLLRWKPEGVFIFLILFWRKRSKKASCDINLFLLCNALSYGNFRSLDWFVEMCADYFAYTFMNLLYYNVSFRQSLIFSAIDYAVIVLVDYVILCFCMIISPETGQAVIEKEHLPGLIAKQYGLLFY